MTHKDIFIFYLVISTETALLLSKQLLRFIPPYEIGYELNSFKSKLLV